jgi:urea carboxylase-associated protein 2
MQTCFANLPALARSMVPENATAFSPAQVLWQEPVPGGAHWSGVLRRGTILCSITDDTCGWHDPVCGILGDTAMHAQYGSARYQEHRNEMYRSARAGLLIELAKWGLDRRDLGGNINFFSKVNADADGALTFDRSHRQPGQYVDLRCEMNVLVVLSAAPHPLDPGTTYAPGAVELTAWRSGTASASDACRQKCPENERGFINTERWFL